MVKGMPFKKKNLHGEAKRVVNKIRSWETLATTKQRDLLMLIHARLSETGVAPSFDEMKDEVGLEI